MRLHNTKLLLLLIATGLSPVLFFAAGLAGLQHGRRSPRVVRVAHVDLYGHGGTVSMVDFPSQRVNVCKKKKTAFKYGTNINKNAKRLGSSTGR